MIFFQKRANWTLQNKSKGFQKRTDRVLKPGGQYSTVYIVYKMDFAISKDKCPQINNTKMIFLLSLLLIFLSSIKNVRALFSFLFFSRPGRPGYRRRPIELRKCPLSGSIMFNIQPGITTMIALITLSDNFLTDWFWPRILIFYRNPLTWSNNHSMFCEKLQKSTAYSISYILYTINYFIIPLKISREKTLWPTCLPLL